MGRTVGAENPERHLLFHDTLAPHLAPIRNRLLRLTADSPDLLAVIKQEGRI